MNMRDKIYPILHLDTNKSQGTTPKTIHSGIAVSNINIVLLRIIIEIEYGCK